MAGLTLPSSEAQSQPTTPNRKRALRVAHMTDIHVQPEGKAPSGMTACMKHAHDLIDRPDLILNGGDSVMDVMGADAARAKAQGDLWKKILEDHCEIPIEHCIGNHDVWAWGRDSAEKLQENALYGKEWARELFRIPERYRSFDKAGWHFIVLDSTFPHDKGYKARLDDEQFEWLKEDLKKTPAATPVCVLSHIPIVCACAMFDGENEKSGNWVIPGAWMHIDARRIKDLFFQHKNVKLCLSGHIHLYDRVEYNGVTYICNGAVSGAWWGGQFQETKPGYGLIDLYTDGTFENEYVNYGG